jgi:hypothetical protein
MGQALKLSEEEGFAQACATIERHDLYSQEHELKECSSQCQTPRKPEEEATTRSTLRQRGTERKTIWEEIPTMDRKELTFQVVECLEEECDVLNIHISTYHLRDPQTWKTGQSTGKGGEGATGLLPAREAHPLSEEEIRRNKDGGGIPETSGG